MVQPARRLALLFSSAFVLVSSWPAHRAAADAVVWTGPAITFTKQPTDPTDEITDNVWIARGGSGQGGIFNSAAGETEYVRFTSPADTEWATSVMPENDGQTISAANWEQLEFTAWADAYGGPGSGLLANITVRNAVVHLITDDIYLDLQFTQFNSTGHFAYQRSTPALATPGDHNGDGDVNILDYVVWRTTNIDADQGYADWRSHYTGDGIGSGAAAAVPEPCSLVALLLLAAIAAHCTSGRSASMPPRM